MNFSSEESQNWKILSSEARPLKIEESEPEKSLTQRIVNAKGVSIKCTLNTAEAKQTQKSFVKALYGRLLIDWSLKYNNHFNKIQRYTYNCQIYEKEMIK